MAGQLRILSALGVPGHCKSVFCGIESAVFRLTFPILAQGRGEGRKLRRRRWQQRVLEKKALRREQTDQLRTQAKAQLAAKVSVAEEQRRSVTEEGDGAGERLRRLQELRAQLGRAALREPVNTS